MGKKEKPLLDARIISFIVITLLLAYPLGMGGAVIVAIFGTMLWEALIEIHNEKNKKK